MAPDRALKKQQRNTLRIGDRLQIACHAGKEHPLHDSIPRDDPVKGEHIDRRNNARARWKIVLSQDPGCQCEQVNRFAQRCRTALKGGTKLRFAEAIPAFLIKYLQD